VPAVINLNTALYDVIGLDWVTADQSPENYYVAIDGWNKGELTTGAKYFACIPYPAINQHLNLFEENTPKPLSQLRITCRPLDPSVVISHYTYWIEFSSIYQSKNKKQSIWPYKELI